LDGRLCVPFGPDVQQACRERVAASTQIARDLTTSPAGPHERTVAQVAATLAINTNVVYYWLETGWLDARKGPGGRWLIAFTTDVASQCRQRIAASVHLKPLSQPQTPRSTARRAV
jgi:hypothetical protein